MIAQFKQDLYHKKFTLEDQGKDDEIDTLDNRFKIWLKIIKNARGPVPDNLHDFDNNNDGFDETVHGAQIIPERRELKKLLEIIRCKWVRNQLKYL